jgi:uncharacterized small protein (DUF1192 family)
MYNDLDRIMILQEEIAILKSRLEPHDTGHLHTTIHVLSERVVELREEIDARLHSSRS